MSLGRSSGAGDSVSYYNVNQAVVGLKAKLRLLAIVYADFFRGIPTILLVYILGFGIPALQLEGVPVSEFFWGTVALVALLGVVETFRQSQIDVAATFNFTPYLATALMFLITTVPMTRFTDWLIARDRRRRQAAGVAA